MDIRKIFQYALEREKEGKRFYEQNASRLNNAAAVGAFKRLAQEEQKHAEYIQRHLDALETGETPSSVKIPGDLAIFTQRMEGESVEQSVSEAMVADLPVLRMAYLIERDFAEFYEGAAEQAQGEARQTLLTLAEWERRHEQLFKEMHEQALELYAQMPWGG